MKQQTFNNKQYSIPQAWSEVTVDMLIKSAELAELLDDAPIIAIISAYTNIPISELKLSKSSEVQEIINTMSFITTPYEPQPAISFTLDGIDYECENELVNQKFEDFVSIQTALYNFKEEPARALPRLLAILCKREGETLDSIDLNERSKLMEKLPMTDAKNIEAFFLHSLNAYKSLTLLSSTTDIQKELVLHKLKELQNIMKAHKERNGISFGTKLRIGYYQIYLLWVKSLLVKYFNSIATNNSKKTFSMTLKNFLTKMLKRKSNVK